MSKHRTFLQNSGSFDHEYLVGDHVFKGSGDYTFAGVVRGVFPKASGAVRYVVEDDRGLLFIFNEASLKPQDSIAQSSSRT